MLKIHPLHIGVVFAAMPLLLALSGPSRGDPFQGDVNAGQVVFIDRCVGCHEPPTFDGFSKEDRAKYDAGISSNPNEASGRGPTLVRLIGRVAGGVTDYRYSDAMKASGIVWDEVTLRAFLLKPSAYVPKTTMMFIGMKRQGELDSLINYLSQAK